jgi:hypothetical protein
MDGDAELLLDTLCSYLIDPHGFGLFHATGRSC